jgi:glycosyltransferase involved in cell wall biosynthesis
MLTYNWGTTEWAMANNIVGICAHVHFESGFGPDESPRRQLWRRVMTRRLLLTKCKHIVVPSMTLQDVASRVWRISADRLIYLPNGVACLRFARPADASTLAALSIPDGAPIVGTVAVLRPEKNLLRLIRVFAAIPSELDARLVIVGEGPEGPTLRAAAAKAGLSDRIIFAGHLSDPATILGRFDVFVLTSDTEQMPNAVLEAMAAGRAVVTTDVGDTKFMLSPENAPFAVPLEDEAALSHAIARLLTDQALTARIGEANRRRAESHFSLDKMVADYEKLYSGSIGGRHL